MFLKFYLLTVVELAKSVGTLVEKILKLVLSKQENDEPEGADNSYESE